RDTPRQDTRGDPGRTPGLTLNGQPRVRPPRAAYGEPTPPCNERRRPHKSAARASRRHHGASHARRLPEAVWLLEPCVTLATRVGQIPTISQPVGGTAYIVDDISVRRQILLNLLRSRRQSVESDAKRHAVGSKRRPSTES